MAKRGLVKTEADIEAIALSGAILARTLEEVSKMVAPGVTTDQLNQFAEKLIYEAHAKPSFKGYGPRKNSFPAGLCTSVNSEVVHGVPGDYVLKEGDIVGLDLGVDYNGYFSDGARTVAVGKISERTHELLRVTEKALNEAIKVAKPGNYIGDIGYAIQATVEASGFSVVRELIGHGVGYAVHEDPEVPCYGRPHTGLRLSEGMVLAIEPMVSMGDWKVESLPGEWPVFTRDGSLAAHFEHTVAITKNGPRVLTKIVAKD